MCGVALSGALSSTLGKVTTDLIGVAFYGGNFGTWEDYAIAFAFGGLTGSLGSVTGSFSALAKGAKFVSDVALRPAVNQVVKAEMIEYTSVRKESDGNGLIIYRKPKFYIPEENKYIILYTKDVEIGKTYTIRYYPNTKICEVNELVN